MSASTIIMRSDGLGHKVVQDLDPTLDVSTENSVLLSSGVYLIQSNGLQNTSL